MPLQPHKSAVYSINNAPWFAQVFCEDQFHTLKQQLILSLRCFCLYNWRLVMEQCAGSSIIDCGTHVPGAA